MVGAGWDKAGKAVRGLYALGFSGVEVGSVLAFPQEGNPKPRQFMIGPGVCLNNLGFNTPDEGLSEVARNLDRYIGSRIPIGISIGKNKNIEARLAPWLHAIVARRLYDHASYFVINVSSPNTPGLRVLQDKGPLTDIVQAVNSVMDERGKRKPLFVKISPDLTFFALDDVIEVALNNKAGIIACNTTDNQDIKGKYGQNWRNMPGGVSGDDLDYRAMVNEKIRHIRSQDKDIEIIGVGGVNSPETALEKMEEGANVIQVVTGIRSEGPSVANKINRGIARRMDRDGVKSVSEYTNLRHQNLAA